MNCHREADLKKHYTRPTVEAWHTAKTPNLLETLSSEGTVEEWILDETEMDESNYI